MLAAMLLAGCSKDDGNSVQQAGGEAQEICVQTNLTKMLDGTRATTYDDAAGLQAEAHFTCTAYNAGTLTEYIPTTTVDWNSTQWQFNNGASHYYWPLPASNGGAWPSLDFFGYMPSAANLSTEAPYIGSINYTAEHNVTFTCSGLPMTNAEQGSSLKEFMFGMALDQNYGNAAAGVPLTFQHPFARIKLQLAASHPDITINSITFKSIKNNGDYDHSETPKWTTTGVATDFVLSLSDAAAIFDNNPASPTQIGTDFIMIPQDWTGVIEVNADCLFWGEKKNYSSLTTTVPTDWQPGYSYTYTFNISPDDLIVNIAKFTEQW
jgi:hypothetical protein